MNFVFTIEHFPFIPPPPPKCFIGVEPLEKSRSLYELIVFEMAGKRKYFFSAILGKLHATITVLRFFLAALGMAILVWVNSVCS